MIGAFQAGVLAHEVLWTPRYMSPLAWLDASLSNTLTIDSGKVSAWLDISGNEKNASQASAALRPVYSSTDKIVTFLSDAANLSLVFPFSALTTQSVWVVAAAYTHTIGSDTVQNAYSAIGALSYPNTVALETSNGYIQTAFPYANVEVNSGATNLTRRINGGSAGLATTFNTFNILHLKGSGLSGAGTAALGGDRNSRSKSYFMVKELIVVNSIVDDATTYKAEGYLAHKWGLTGSLSESHPYKSMVPLV